MTTFTNNPQLPAASSDTYTPDQLIAGSFSKVTEQAASITGAAALARGTVLGQVTRGAVSSAAKAGGNTGNGTLTIDVTTPALINSTPGVYTVRLITAAVNGGTFEVKDPKGQALGVVAVGATFADQIKFATADGATDFVVGDGFDITVAAGSGKFKKSVATATDGSQNPNAILADAADASGGDVNGAVYLTGEFNGAKLIMDASWSVATLKPILRALGIYIRTAVTADAAS